MARVFHPLAISMSTNEDAMMFQFIGNICFVMSVYWSVWIHEYE